MRWRYSIHHQDQKLVFLFFALWTTTLLLSALVFLFGPPLVPLWYSLPLAREQLAASEYVWVFPGLSAVITLMSLWQGRKSDLEHERYLARLSLISGLALMVFLLLAQIRILKIIL